jgi:hypothetical protein
MQATVRTPKARTEPANGQHSRSPITFSLLALAGVFFVGTVVMTIVAASLASDLGHERDRRDAVESRSSQFATRFLTYDGRKLAEAQRSVARLSTARLRAHYAQAVKGVRPALEASRSTAHANATGVFVGEVSGQRATTVVTVDVVVRADGQPERRQRQVLALTLVRADRDWLVDSVTDLRTTPAVSTARAS